jgi:hypothetical protein
MDERFENSKSFLEREKEGKGKGGEEGRRKGGEDKEIEKEKLENGMDK